MSTEPVDRRLQLLLATDLSPASEPHVVFGVRLGELLGARTTLYHAALMPSLAAQEALVGTALAAAFDPDAARRRLQEVASTLPVDRPVHVEIETAANARKAILAAAERLHADLLILPTHGRSGLERALLGSTAEDVLRHAHRPVLLLTDRMVQRRLERNQAPRFVVVPTDLGPEATAAHGPAADLARRLGLPLLLLSVLPARQPPAARGLPAAPAPVEPQQRIQERVKELRRIASGFATDLHVEVFACIDDDPAAAIVAKAGAFDSAFVVVATHARTGLARLFRGSVAENVVRHATVPVVCVPIGPA